MGKTDWHRINVVKTYIEALNTRDLPTVERLVGTDCKLIDSRGGWVRGRDDCIEASRRFFAMPIDFSIKIDSAIARDGEVLVRGKVRSNDRVLAHDCLWRAVSNGEQMFEFQSYAQGEAKPVAHLLMPASARYG